MLKAKLHLPHHCLRTGARKSARIVLGPEWRSFRAEARGFPDLRYYEGLGRTHYRMASDHRLAQRYEVANIFNTLAERFEATRMALNDISERLFSLGDPDYSLETLLAGKKASGN